MINENNLITKKELVDTAKKVAQKVKEHIQEPNENITPKEDDTYSLGSPEKAYKDIYVKDVYFKTYEVDGNGYYVCYDDPECTRKHDTTGMKEADITALIESGTCYAKRIIVKGIEMRDNDRFWVNLNEVRLSSTDTQLDVAIKINHKDGISLGYQGANDNLIPDDYKDARGKIIKDPTGIGKKLMYFNDQAVSRDGRKRDWYISYIKGELQPDGTYTYSLKETTLSEYINAVANTRVIDDAWDAIYGNLMTELSNYLTINDAQGQYASKEDLSDYLPLTDVDQEMSDESQHPISNAAAKAYVDGKIVSDDHINSLIETYINTHFTAAEDVEGGF